MDDDRERAKGSDAGPLSCFAGITGVFSSSLTWLRFFTRSQSASEAPLSRCECTKQGDFIGALGFCNREGKALAGETVAVSGDLDSSSTTSGFHDWRLDSSKFNELGRPLPRRAIDGAMVWLLLEGIGVVGGVEKVSVSGESTDRWDMVKNELLFRVYGYINAPLRLPSSQWLICIGCNLLFH